MRFFFLIIISSVFFSCKKKEECPAPKAGQTIVNDVSGKYSGYFTSTIEYNHGFNPQDTNIISHLYFYDTPTNQYGSQTSVVGTVDVSGYPSYNSFSYYFCVIDNSNPPAAYKSLFNFIIYNFDSSHFGTIAFADNRPAGNFSNSVSIPLNFSNTTPYSVTLNSVTNCNKINITIYDGVSFVERSILPTNPTAKFYASEFGNTTTGNTTGMDISLINSKDTTISGFKFKIEKIVKHRYELTYTN